MMGSCVTEAAQDVGGLHHRPLSATANHLRGPQQQPLVNNQSPHSQHALYSSHHQPQHSHSHLQHQPHPYTAPTMGSYSAGAGSMQPLSQHHAAPTSQHNMRGHSMSHMSSSSSSAGSNSFMDSGPVGYAASPPSSSGSSTTMAPPPLLPLPMSLSTRHGQQQHQHQHQHQHQLGQQTDESTNAGFLQQLLHGGMPTDEELVSVGGASLSLMAATYHGQQSQQQPQQPQQQQQQMGYGSGGQPHSHSHNPTPASTGTPTNSSEELPCIFDELDMFQENPNSLVSPSCFSHHPATVPPQHHHAGAMEPGSGTNNSLQLLTITSAPLPTAPTTADAMSLESTGGRRRKVDDLYGDINSVGISNGDCAAAADGVSHGRRGSHPGHGAKRIRYNRSRSASCSSAAAVKPEPEEFAAALASSSSSSSSSAAASSETSNIDLEDIYVGVRDQVVYWGNSKNKYDVTVCVRAPTRYCGLLKGATVSYQVSLPAMQEFKMKSRSGAKGKGKPKAETVKKAVLQLVRTESDNGVVEFEAFLKNCLPTEKLSNLTLLELHFNITPKQHATMGKAGEEIKASFNLGSSASSSAVRGGRRKQSVGGDDDDFEDEEDGRESLDEDEYVPTARGRGGRGGRGKANGRGGQRGKTNHQRDEERESDDPAGVGMDYHQFDMAFAAADGLASIERKVPVVTYTHSKAITRALCRLIWYPMNEENTMSTDFLLEKLCKYFASQLQLPISIYDRHNLAAMLSPFTNGITYVEFYSLLGEWFVLAIKMAKKKTQCLWQQGRETFIPLLFNPYRRINNDSAATASAAGGSSTASNNTGDDDEWTEDNEASESTRRTGRGRGRRSRSGSRAGLPQPMAKSTAAEDCGLLNGAADVIAALQLDAVLEREGDFLVTIGPDLKERHGRAEGEEGRGVNYFPSLKYPLQIVYVKADGEKQCLSVENKLDKLTDFIHAKQCLRDYLVLQRDGVWKRVEKDQFAFNHAQQRRLEETLGRTSVLGREDSESLSYAHA